MKDRSSDPQTVLVTGAGDSVGRVIAEKFHRKGLQVHICDNREEALSNTLAENPGMTGTVADVGVPTQVEGLFEAALAEMESIDVLVYCVGIGGPRAPIEEISYEDWEEVIRINLNGFFQCAKAVIPAMKSRREGSIIGFSTASTKTAVPLRSPYVASKAGLEGLVRCLARELGPYNIRCNAILPGAINNARLNQILERNARARKVPVETIEQELLQYISLRRKINMDEFADLILFLTSQKGRSISGQLIELGGNVEWEDS